MQLCFVRWLDARRCRRCSAKRAGEPHPKHPWGIPPPKAGASDVGRTPGILGPSGTALGPTSGCQHLWISATMLEKALHPQAHRSPACTPLCTSLWKGREQGFLMHIQTKIPLFALPFLKIKVKLPSQHERLDKHSSFPQQKLQKCL